MTTIDKDNVREAYESVRDDKNETTWFEYFCAAFALNF